MFASNPLARSVSCFLLAAWLACMAPAIPAVDAAPTREGNLLLIVPPYFADTAPLQEFIAWKTSRGLTVSSYLVSANTSRDAIREYIVSLWETEAQPDYILLIGDTAGSSSTSATIPFWNGTGSLSAPTDWPYGCMPGGIEWYPDIPVGRFSAASLEHLQAMVTKTIVVESGDYPDPEYAHRGAFLANSATSNVAEAAHDWVIDNYFTPRGYEGIKIYAVDGGETADVAEAVNRGCFWVAYIGHSGPNGWWEPQFDGDDINALTNANLYGLVFGWSCASAQYSSNECFGESWLRAADKGSAAYIAASTSIHYGGYEQWLFAGEHEKEFLGAFLEENIWEVGPAWIRGLYRLLENHGQWDGDMDHLPSYGAEILHDIFEEFVILGDPSLDMAAGAMAMTVSPYGGFESGGEAGGPFTPDHYEYILKNRSEDPIEFAVACDLPWLSIEPAEGAIAAGDEVSVTLSLNALAYAFHYGTYAGTVQFTNQTTHEGDATRDVTLAVGLSVQQYEWNLDANPGWTTTGQWAFGQPTGQGGAHGNPDPASGATGANVYGVNLNGDYAISIGGPYYLTTEPIDLSDVILNIKLKFQRWLNIDDPPYARASIQIDDGESGWISLWNSTNTITDSMWIPQSIDITEYAAGKSAVRFRWGYTAVTGALAYSGWNIDDVEIWGVPREAALPGDVDGDWDVDLADLGALLAVYGLCEGDAGFNAAADFDANGCVNLTDLGALLANYGYSG